MTWAHALLALLVINLVAWAVVTRQLIVLRRDQVRLDWLQTTMGPEQVVPDGAPAVNSWLVRWPCRDVREAIDKNREWSA